jgi:mono/diheme cytochrome c family protein
MLLRRMPLLGSVPRHSLLSAIALFATWVAAIGAPPSVDDDKVVDRQVEDGHVDDRKALNEYRDAIEPILKEACSDCHGPSLQEGNVRIDTLDPNLLTGKDVSWWTEVYAVISKGEMPPPDSSELADADRKRVVEWLSGELHAASIARRQSASHTAFRRLTRYETNYALQDLLGLPWNFAKDLPPEAHSEDGFQNSSELLHMSVSQFETYHRLARTALARAVTLGEQPTPLTWGVSMKDASRLEWGKQDALIEEANKKFKDQPEALDTELKRLEDQFKISHPRTYFRNLINGRTAPATWEYYDAKYAHAPLNEPIESPKSTDHVAILPAGQWLNIELGNQLPDEGTLRVRVRASQAPGLNQPPSLQLHFGWQASNEGRALLRVSQQDTPIVSSADDPQFYQWDVPLGEIYPRNSVRKTSPMGALPSPSEYIRFVNSSASPGDIVIDFVEVVAPVYEPWPSASHRNLFFDSAVASDEHAYVREILARFMTRAWRRPPRPQELDQKMELFHRIRKDCDRFEEATLEVLATVLSSPNFLYIVQEGTSPEATPDRPLETGQRPRLSPHELATRLSMFLWCSIPDEELLRLASDGRLLEEDVLRAQVERMLSDERSQRFSEQFVLQWLNMELLEFLNFNQHLPGFDPLLKEAMQREPVALFQEILKNNESVIHFIHADYAMVNERLARHYGMQGVYGNHFRRVAWDRDWNRGGLLTQAGLLAMNSDYPDSHPLKRGKWLLVSLLNDPPPPPPPAVPQIDLANPEIAKMTLKERIEDHRNHAACMSCHIKIDPWGIAFENYDALGRWRDQIQGKPVDASSELFNKQTLDGMVGLKRFLLENRQDQFVSAMVHKVATYGLGRPLRFSDRADLESITQQVRNQGDGLRTLLQEVATSELFRSK